MTCYLLRPSDDKNDTGLHALGLGLVSDIASDIVNIHVNIVDLFIYKTSVCDCVDCALSEHSQTFRMPVLTSNRLWTSELLC